MKTILNCRASGITQEDLSNKLKVSLPTVKRWFSGKGVGLENLFEMLRVLDVPFEDLAALLPHAALPKFHYTSAQEEFFAAYPAYLSYFDHLLYGATPQQLEKKFLLSLRSTRRYLKALEELELIEVHPHSQIKLLVKGEPVWSPNGALAVAMKKDAFEDFIAVAIGRPEQLSLLLHRYSAEDAMELQDDIDKLKQKSQMFHRRSLALGGATKAYGLALGLAPFQWRTLSVIPEL